MLNHNHALTIAKVREPRFIRGNSQGVDMKLVLAGLALLASGAVAHADDLATMQLASGLGSVLAAEEACGLSFDQSAIEKFITAKVPADNLNFSGTLNMMVSGAKLELDGMSPSQKTANCTQVKRVAKSYGFTK